jgi:hypothetical protein
VRNLRAQPDKNQQRHFSQMLDGSHINDSLRGGRSIMFQTPVDAKVR